MALYISDTRPSRRWNAINTSVDTIFDVAPKGIRIGDAGNIVLVGSDGVAATFAVQAGDVLAVMPAAIRAAGTIATNVIALN